jgi:hypothetical protein
LRREILILDVTAMSGDNVCVAGIDLDSKQTIRLNEPQPMRERLTAIGGLTPGELIAVDVEPLAHVTPPHVEDHVWNPRSVEKLRRMDNAEILSAIRSTASRSLEEALGEPVTHGRKRNSAWAPGVGARSLATLRVRYVRFEQDDRGAIRAALRDDAEEYWGWIPLQDLVVREHRMSSNCCEEGNLLTHVRSDFEANACLIRVGLTRPFSPDEHADNSACWLQVTNIFARDRTHFF